MQEQHTCPRCSGAMEEGFVIDRTDGASVQSEWTEGEPERSFWSFWTGLKLKGHERHPIITFRCERCGYLESYAPAASNSGQQ